MKKIYLLITIIFSITCLTGCGKISEEILFENMKKIELTGNLVTYEAYYNNVIEYDKPATHLFEIDRRMFIEYTGIIKYGVNLSDVKIKVDSGNIIVSLPKAKIIGEPNINKEDFDANNFILSKDSWMNLNPITADDSSAALIKAQNELKEKAEQDEETLTLARNRAKFLIEEKINKISGISTKKLNIVWEEI